MNGRLAPNRMWVPSASVSRMGGRPTTTVAVGAALIATAPPTVTVSLAAVLGSGIISSVLVVTGDRWLALRRRTE